MPLTKYARNQDGNYGPTNNGHYYISKLDHRKTASFKKGKTRWSIDEGEEFGVFKPACEDYESWYCEKNNCIFGIVDNGIVLGKNGEMIAKFPNDRNEGEPWHGYPVFTEQSQNRPSSELLELLKDRLPMSLIIKIEKGVL